MSQSETTHMLPSSYEDAMHGDPPPETPDDNLPVTDTPIQSPQPPATEVAPQSSLQSNILQPYSVYPPEAELLLNLDEISVHSFMGSNFIIKDHAENPIMNASMIWNGSCFQWCTCNCAVTIALFPLGGSACAAHALLVTDNCCNCEMNPQKVMQHLEVMTLSDAPLGEVRMCKSQTTIVNQSEDLLFTGEQKFDCCDDNKTYEIFAPCGRKVANIERGDKHKLLVNKEIPVQHKILLLFLTIVLQYQEHQKKYAR